MKPNCRADVIDPGHASDQPISRYRPGITALTVNPGDVQANRAITSTGRTCRETVGMVRL